MSGIGLLAILGIVLTAGQYQEKVNNIESRQEGNDRIISRAVENQNGIKTDLAVVKQKVESLTEKVDDNKKILQRIDRKLP